MIWSLLSPTRVVSKDVDALTSSVDPISVGLGKRRCVPFSAIDAMAWFSLLRSSAFSCSNSSFLCIACINFALVSLVAVKSDIRLSKPSM
jgi:hypothetical protein